MTDFELTDLPVVIPEEAVAAEEVKVLAGVGTLVDILGIKAAQAYIAEEKATRQILCRQALDRWPQAISGPGQIVRRTRSF